MSHKNIMDHHMHTMFSPDADPTLSFDHYVKRAEAMGVSGLMFTDHVDFDSPAPIFNKMIDYDLYTYELARAQEKTDIHLHMGVEIGYQPHLNDRLNTLLESYPFDFVICSMHIADGLDFYNGDFFIGKTQQSAYRRYFENVLNNVIAYDNYDVYGHLDYITRYGGYANRTYSYEAYQDIIEEILKVIISKGKGIEINTSGLRYGLGVTHPGLYLLKAYKRLGGKIITFGSDAHYVKDYYFGYEQTITLLKEAGFHELTVFKHRIPHFISID